MFVNDAAAVSWKTRFTDPKNHDDHSFVYLVISLKSAASRNTGIRYRKEKGNYDPAQDVDLRLTPSKLHQINIISASIVSNKNPYILTDDAYSGVIIECPVENIVYASRKDLLIALSPGKLTDILRRVNNGELKTPSVDDLLAGEIKQFNEVIICGQSQFGKTRVIGFFELPQRPDALLHQRSKETALPIIRYPWTSGTIMQSLLEEVGLRLFDHNVDQKTPPALPSIPSPEQNKRVPSTQDKKLFGGFKKGFLLQSTPQPKNEQGKKLNEDSKDNPASTGYCGFRKGFLG